MKKTFSIILAALMLAGSTSTAFAFDSISAADKAPDALSGGEFALAEKADLLVGPMPLVEGTVKDAFDGDPTTIANFGVDGGDEWWVGIKLDRPTILTKVEMHAPGYRDDGTVNRPHVLYGTIVEGSNDGKNWEFILQLGDDYLEYEEYCWDMEDGLNDWFDEAAWDLDNTKYVDDDPTVPVAYTYYRVWNDTKGVAVYGDIQLYGYYAEGTDEPSEPETEAPELPPAEGDVVVSFSDVRAQAGDTIDIEVRVDSTVIWNSLAIAELSYDSSALTFVGFENPGDALLKSIFGEQGIDQAVGSVAIALMSSEVLSGKICDLRFKVNDGAADGDYSVCMDTVIAGNGSTTIEVGTKAATVTIGEPEQPDIPYMAGDIDGDGCVNITDAIVLIRYFMLPGLYPEAGLYPGSLDFNADGSLNKDDALYVLQYSMFPDLYPVY